MANQYRIVATYAEGESQEFDAGRSEATANRTLDRLRLSVDYGLVPPPQQVAVYRNDEVIRVIVVQTAEGER